MRVSGHQSSLSLLERFTVPIFGNGTKTKTHDAEMGVNIVTTREAKVDNQR